MADAPLGSAAVNIQVNLDQLDQGLNKAQQRLEQFDKTVGGQRQLSGLQKASKDAQAALQMLSDQLQAAQRNSTTAGAGFSVAAGSIAAATSRLAALDQELASAENTLNAARQQGIGLLGQQSAMMGQSANDNKRVGSAVDAAGTSIKNFAQTAQHLLKVSSYLGLVATVAVKSSPALQEFTGKLGSGIAKAAVSAGNASVAAGAAIASVGPLATKAGASLAELGPIGARAGVAIAGIAPAAVIAGTAVAGIGPVVKNTAATMSPFLKLFGGAELLMMGSHAKLLAAALIALSPALRSVVGHEFAASLKSIPVVAGTSITALGLFKNVIGDSIGFLARLAIPLTITYGAWKLLSGSVEAANEKFKEFNDIRSKAGEGGVSVELFKRQIKGADELDISFEKLSETMKKFNEVTNAQLGGSDLQQKLDALVKAGNFANNEGVSAFKIAPDTEARWNAMIKLIGIAFKQNEGLAALDWTKAFLPDKIQKKLEKDHDIIQKLADETAKIKPVNIIDDAADKQNKIFSGELDEIKKQLGQIRGAAKEAADDFQPIVLLGLKLKEVWVASSATIKELQIKAVEYAQTSLHYVADADAAIKRFGGKPLIDTQAIADFKGADKAAQLDWLKTLEARMDAANKKLREVPDVSKPIHNSAVEFDRLSFSLGKSAAAMEAESKAIGLSVGDHEKMQVAARLTEAALQDLQKLNPLATIADISPATLQKITVLSTRLGAVKQEVAQLTAVNKANFDLRTSGLNDLEKQIAGVNFTLHGDAWDKWMNSGVAATIRLTAALTTLKDFSKDAAARANSSRLEAEAYNKSAGEAAAYKFVEEQVFQAKQKGVMLSPQVIAGLKAEADAIVGTAAQYAALTIIQKDIARGKQTSMLSSADVQIAEQLKGIFPDVATALKSAEAAGLRFNMTLQASKSFKDQIQGQVDSLKTEAATYDMAAGAAAQYKAVQDYISQQKIKGLPLSDDAIAKLKEETGGLSEVAQAAALLKVNKDIAFGRATAFLTPEDVQIAQQLKVIYGNDIPAAMASSEAAALRMNNAMSQVSQSISGGLSTALLDISMHTKTAGEAFNAFGLTVISAIQKMIIELLIVGPLMRSLRDMMGGGSGFNIFSLFSGSGSGAVEAGNAAVGSSGLGFLSGGMIGVNGTPRYVHPAYFDNAPRMGSGGMIDWAAGERPIIGHTGERVLNRQETAAYNRGGGSTINVSQTNNINGSDMTKEQLMALMVQNNKDLTKQINAALPDRVAAINRDPRKRG